MDENQFNFIRKVFNEVKLKDISLVSKKSLLISFDKDIRLFIDSTPAGIDISLEPMTDEAADLLDKIEATKN